MNSNQIIQSWKNDNLYHSLTAKDHAFPANPAGGIQLSERELVDVSGGDLSLTTLTTVDTPWCGLTFSGSTCY
jgi:mersacidin/lichenicidin family type 2 lantibiotic